MLANFCLSAAYHETATVTDDDASRFVSVQNKLRVEFIIFLRSLVWRQISLDHCAKEMRYFDSRLLRLIKLAKCLFVMYGVSFVTYVHLGAFPCLMVFEIW